MVEVFSPDVAVGWLAVFVVAAAVSVVTAVTTASALGQLSVAFLLTVSAVGVYGGPPDTEWSHAVLALLTLASFLLLCDRPSWTRAAPWSAAGSAVLLLWAGLVGSVGRPAAFPGVVGCLGLFLVGPLVDPALRGRAPLTPPGLAVRAVAHAACVYGCGRIAALRSDPAGSVTISALSCAALAMALAALAAADRWSRRRHHLDSAQLAGLIVWRRLVRRSHSTTSSRHAPVRST